MTRKTISLIFIILFCSSNGLLVAQNYQAMHGSPYAGSLGIAANPASIVHVPFKWDVTPFALQLKHSTNAFTISNYSLVSSPATAEAVFSTGEKKRFLMANQDIRLLNARMRLNDVSAIAFGASVRSYVSAVTAAFNWQDTTAYLEDLLDINTGNTPLSAEVRGMAWAELFATYARTVRDIGDGILNAGITLKVNRGLGAGFTTASDLDYFPAAVNGKPGYIFRSAELAYGYSSNFDVLDSNLTATVERKELLRQTFSTIAASIGVEYILPSGEVDDEYAYDLKIGAALLDIGFNKFQYSANSRKAQLNKDNISDSLLAITFQDLGSVDALPDSLQALLGSTTSLTGKLKMFQPARLVINADKHLSGNFFINAELTLPLASLTGKSNLFVRDMNLAAVTPRFETRSFGFYLPVTLNTRQQVWVGTALRAGPVLLGLHSLANLFSKNKIQNGGAYLAVTFRPGQKKEDKENPGRTRSDRLRGKKGKQLGCPVF